MRGGSEDRDGKVHTSFWGKLVYIDVETDVVLWLWLCPEHCTVLALEDIVDTVLEQLVPASDAHGEKKGGFAICGG